ncbi:MAG TPA: tRNA preQ1(34) S-adenosylmethionine ribosyltransferase-isomerase QueA [Candidatus Acidoferrales bacterium]|nr:tRNA preQ1(34) S-adenosylmethionine ribosyltransferase-isomerase QueA [Candidatus Acidoferrales bacterium]
MKLSDFDYELSPERIAQWPLQERDASRMLLLGRNSGAWEDRNFRELPELLRGDELIIINTSRVLPARLFGYRKGIHAQHPAKHDPARHEHLSASVEVLLLRSFGNGEWEALVRPGRKIPVGEIIVFGESQLEAEVTAREGYGIRRLRFSATADLTKAIEQIGHIPLPPYIKREDSPLDRERYQTVFAREGAAVAAPTAGLHFTPEILARVRAKGVEISEVILDVGLGTFEPIRAETLEEHHIHSEAYEIPEATAEAITRARSDGRPVLAIGTTVVRALEDAAEKSAASSSPLQAGRAEANIFLYPGKKFLIVKQLLTNFHLPRSSLLALVAAFAGREKVLAAYRHAVESAYRFYSYGDCMLIR